MLIPKVVARDEESGERVTASLDIEVLQRGQAGMLDDMKRKVLAQRALCSGRETPETSQNKPKTKRDNLILFEKVNSRQPRYGS